MSSQVLSLYNILTVGETPYTHDPALILPYVQPSAKELQMCFHFDFLNLDGSRSHSGMKPQTWNLKQLKDVVAKWQVEMHLNGGWNSI